MRMCINMLLPQCTPQYSNRLGACVCSKGQTAILPSAEYKTKTNHKTEHAYNIAWLCLQSFRHLPQPNGRLFLSIHQINVFPRGGNPESAPQCDKLPV